MRWLMVFGALQTAWQDLAGAPEEGGDGQTKEANWLLALTADHRLVTAMARRLLGHRCVAFGVLWGALGLDEVAAQVQSSFAESDGLPLVD